MGIGFIAQSFEFDIETNALTESIALLELFYLVYLNIKKTYNVNFM